MASRFRIDRSSAIPVYVQLGEQIRLLVHRGVLKRGDPMPTVRELAVELGVNANTVTRVYRDLQGEGLLRLERGIGTFVEGASGAPTLARRDFERIARQTRELVSMCRRAGLSSRELASLIESTWKERPDEG